MTQPFSVYGPLDAYKHDCIEYGWDNEATGGRLLLLGGIPKVGARRNDALRPNKSCGAK